MLNIVDMKISKYTLAKHNYLIKKGFQKSINLDIWVLLDSQYSITEDYVVNSHFHKLKFTTSLIISVSNWGWN